MVDELDELEREIDTTRARLKANVAAIGSGYTMDDLKATIKYEVLEAKDDALAFARTSAADMARQGYETLKQKATANPAAALMIGAGIGWKLWKNPPVASALAGIGLFSLFSSRENDPIRTATHYVRDTVEDTATATVATVTRAAHDLRDAVGTVAGSAKDIAKTANYEAQDVFRSRVKEPSARLLEASETSEGQRQILLTLAGAAVAAAVGVAVHRFRSEGHSDQNGL